MQFSLLLVFFVCDMECVRISDKDRAKKYRDKNKERVRERNKQRMKVVRVKEKAERLIDPIKKQKYRRNEIVRKRLYRLKKKEILSNNTDNLSITSRVRDSYKSPQSFGKAFKKSIRALPKSPTKQVAVVTKLAEKCGLKLESFKKKPLESNKTLQTTVTNFCFPIRHHLHFPRNERRNDYMDKR